MINPRGALPLLAVALGLTATLGLAACGSDQSTTSRPSASGNAAERAFLEGMVPHHESAIAMAEVAAERAQAPEIKQIAEGIADSQTPEINQMSSIHQRLFDAPLVPDEAAHEELGLSSEEAGMGGHAADPASALEDADPFDRAFVDEMVPHHQGAITMANAVLAETDDAELRALAESIVATQEREIEEMNAFRSERYGGPVAVRTAPPPREATMVTRGGDHG